MNTFDMNMNSKLIKIECDLEYLSDIFEKLTILNVSLQHSKLTLLKSKGIINSFKNKLIMYRYNLARTNLNNFPRLLKYKNDNTFLNEDLLKYIAHLNYVITNIYERF